MNFSEKNVIMSLSEMKNLISEWIPNISEKIIMNGEYDSYKRTLEIFNNEDKSIIFRKVFNIDELISENSRVSTQNILSDDLRGLIAQCHELDMQLKESIENAENQKQ